MNARLRKKIPLFLPFLFLVISCGSDSNQTDLPEDVASLANVSVYPGDAAPRHSISFERDARFGDTGDIYIGSIAGVAVRDDGTLFLADRGEAIVHVFGPTGDYRTAIGGKGEGPGEFLSASAPKLYNGELFVLDGQQRRVSVFDAQEFSYLRSHPVGSSGSGISGFPMIAYPLPEDQFLVIQNSIQRDGETFYMRYVPSIYNSEGDTVAAQIVKLRQNPMHTVQSDNSIRLTSLPFMGETHVGFTSSNEIVSGYSDRFLFHLISLDGDTLRSIYHNVTPPPLDRSAMLANIEDETIRKDIGSMDIPETRLVYDSIFTDNDNRFWVEMLTENDDINRWWILAESGEKLAEFDRPASSRIMAVKNSYVYFLEIDEETGLQDVVKYRFSLNDR
jgi:hypothetical protein